MPAGVYVRKPQPRDESALFPADARFSALVRAAEGCWEWQGMRDPRGYGRLSRKNQPILAHRHAWTLTNGEIPAGLCILHRCDNPPCVNPAHLFLGTYADNVADMHAKGRARNGREALTHCAKGHPYDGVNSYAWVRSDGATLRACRACNHAKYLTQKARRAAQRQAHG